MVKTMALNEEAACLIAWVVQETPVSMANVCRLVGIGTAVLRAGFSDEHFGWKLGMIRKLVIAITIII